MKKIGIIDYFIDEWHSNMFMKHFEKVKADLGLEYEVAYGYAEINKEGRLTTAEWCQKNNIIRCETIEEVCEKSDKLLIFAPANPETHLKYAKIALPYGKTTYIDKTFAPDLATAQEIFALAEKYNTKIFSSSALRYAEEITDLSNVKNATITGGGRSLEEYVIHLIEMAEQILHGGKADCVHVFNREKQATVVVEFEKQSATLNYSCGYFGYAVEAETDREICEQRRVEKGTEFYFLFKDILNFFERNQEPVTKEQTLNIMAIRDAVLRALDGEYGQCVSVENY